jgi:ATP-binding cassette subfamily B (MDR/TAP) protein 1
MTAAMFCAGFWYGVSQVNQGLSIGDIFTTFYACLLAAQAIESYQPRLLLLSKGRSAGITLKRVMIEMTDRKVTKLKGILKPASCRGEVKVSNVSLYNSSFT